MIRCLSFLGLFLSLALVIGCSDKRTPAYNPDVGPFDEDGNYVEAWADNPPQRTKRSTPTPPPPQPPRIVSTPKPEVTPSSRPAPKPVSKPKPKPKPIPKPKPKPKPVKVKPKTIRHTVTKGDTLYGLARRYGTSVSAIQKANNLKGTTIRTGKPLVIPQ